MNIKAVGIHPGFLLYPTLPLNKSKTSSIANYDDAFSTTVSSIGTYCNYAASYNVEILVENLDFNHKSNMFMSEDGFSILFEVINAKNLGFL